jgi:taurine dioxygenase
MATPSTVEIDPITPMVGAIASGVGLSRPLDQPTVRQIRQAILNHGVIFFRNQDLTRDETVALMKNFGPLCTDPFSVAALAPPREEDTVHDMPTYGNSRATAVWHMDSTLAPEPAAILALRALKLPPSGGTAHRLFENALSPAFDLSV